MDERILEHAEWLTRVEVESAISRARISVIKPIGFDGRCVECETEIPQARLDTGAITCIDCQTEIEHRRRQCMT